ncbi:unnamed protein product [Ectocarpus fasciculatus]
MLQHRRLRCWLVAFGGTLACRMALAADPSLQQAEHPFRNLAAWLREASPDMRSAEPKAISRGITVLSNSQSYVKSFDGMAYELKGKIKETGSTADIEKLTGQAELYESASSVKKANKLVRLLIEVERALNSAEAAEIASQSDPSRAAQYMEDAGLRFLPEPPPPPPPPSEEENSANSTVAAGAQGDKDGGAADGSTPTRVSSPRRSGEKSEPSGSGLGETSARRRRAAAAAAAGSATASSSSGADRPSVSGDGDSDQRNKKKKKKTKKRARSREEGVAGAAAAGAAAVAGGEPLEAFVVTVAGCEVRCFLMLDERGGEEGEGRLVVAVGDSLTGEALLESLFEEPAVVQLASHGLMRETAYVNRVAFQCACDILEWAGPFIKASVQTGGAFEGYGVHCAGHSFGGAVAACLAGLLDGAIDVEPSREGGGGGGVAGASGRRNGAASRGENLRDRRSTGGGGGRSRSSSSGEEESSEEGGGAVRVDGAEPWVGIRRDKVTCVTLGCPPCLSQNLRLPFVTSFVLGDDMVPRTSHESLRRLKHRLLQVMPKGKGLLSQGMAFSTSLFTDVAGVAMQGVRQATTLGEDDARLTVPGRVWFAKPRRLKNGATLKRVMQGNLKEDMLWQLHDIMLTKSMLSHHRLDKYIKILDRV